MYIIRWSGYFQKGRVHTTRDEEAALDSGTRDISSSRRLGTPSDGSYKGFVCPVSVRGLMTGATLGLTGPKKNFSS